MPSRRPRDEWTSAPPDDGGSAGVFSRPEDEMAHPGSGTQRPMEDRPRAVAKARRAPTLAVVVLVILLLAAVLIFV